MNNVLSLLDRLIQVFSHNNNIHICIHDTSGYLKASGSLLLPPCSRIHASPFCTTAKLTATGLRFCLRCKSFSIKKFMQTKDSYIGKCHMGITEIVKPLYIEDRLICVIYIGNLLVSEDKNDTYSRITRLCRFTGIARDKLVEALLNTQEVPHKELPAYMQMADTICEVIHMSLSNNITREWKFNPVLPARGESTHWLIEDIENYINAYYDRNLKLSQLANLYSINSQYLCRLFKKETGKNFTEYINSCRIEAAKKLLSSTRLNITEISLQLGFNNITYFNRLFLKRTGMTPGSFRKSKSMGL